MKQWVGRKIVSQYGLYCEVLGATEAGGVTTLQCRAFHNGKVWEWDADTVSLVTRAGEILDHGSGEVFGFMDGEHWRLYPDDQCRKLAPDEVEREFGTS